MDVRSITYDIKVGDKIVYTRIPEHSLSLWLKKAQHKLGKKPVAQMRLFR